MLALALASLTLAAAPAERLKLAMPQPQAVRIEDKDADFYGEHFAQQMKQSGVEVFTPREMSSLLGLERQRQLLGCSEGSCMAELANALGADEVVLLSLARVDAQTQVNVKVISATSGKTLGTFSSRASGEGAVLDTLGRAAHEVLLQTFRALGKPAPVELVGASEPSGSHSMLWVVPGAIGVVGVAAGLGLYFSAQSDYHSLTTPNPSHLLTDAEAQGLRNGGKLKEPIAIGCLIGGGAAILAATAWLAVSRVSGGSQQTGVVGFWVAPGNASIVWSIALP